MPSHEDVTDKIPYLEALTMAPWSYQEILSIPCFQRTVILKSFLTTLLSRVRNSSQETLANVRAVETSLLSSALLRNTTKNIQTTNDQKINEIKNITAFVNSRFGNLQSSGEQSLAVINNTINQINDSLMCFAAAKNVVDNATQTVQSAQRLSTDALLVYISVCLLTNLFYPGFPVLLN